MAKFGLLLAVFSAILLSGYVTAITRQTVKASCYVGAIGNRDNNLNDGGYYYAELSTNYQASRADYRALGGLTNGYRLSITCNGRTIQATKGDVGRGGRRNPKIDIHITAARALGFNDCRSFGIRDVIIE